MARHQFDPATDTLETQKRRNSALMLLATGQDHGQGAKRVGSLKGAEKGKVHRVGPAINNQRQSLAIGEGLDGVEANVVSRRAVAEGPEAALLGDFAKGSETLRIGVEDSGGAGLHDLTEKARLGVLVVGH